MKVEDTISIDAAPEVAWRVTIDVERWPEWTPTVTSVRRLGEGSFGLGSTARLKQPGQPEADWVVTEFVAGRRFAWETRRRGLRMVGSHEIVPYAAGVKSLLRVEARGPLALLLWPILRPATRLALTAENRGLKTRCEQLARSAPSTP